MNIKNLFDYLKRAFPNSSSIIDDCYKQHKDMIERIWWVRNKLEHILYTQWPINSNIFQDFNKNPNSPDQAPDHLNYDFLKRTNNTVIEIYRFILNLRPNTPESWQIVTLENFRI